MTLICLVRHGETDWNSIRKIQGRTDIPINETGIRQAKDCSHFLNEFQWNVLVSSPLIRARQTAEIIKEELKLPIIVMENFIERNYGAIEGLTIEERSKLFPDLRCPGQESIEIVRERVMEGIEELHRLYQNKKIILVAHGGVINVILSILSNGMIGTGKTGLSNGSLSNIYFDEGKWKVKNYNQVSHLTKKVKR